MTAPGVPHASARQLADWIAIRELSGHYNRAFDDGDAEALAQLFTPDGRLEIEGIRPRLGHRELAELVQRVGYGSVHVTTDATIDIDGDAARQVCTLILARRHRDRSPQAFELTGRYLDDLARTADGWRFRARRVQLDGTPLARRDHPSRAGGPT